MEIVKEQNKKNVSVFAVDEQGLRAHVHNAFQPLRFPTSFNNKLKHKKDGQGFEVKLHKDKDVFCEHAQEIYNIHVKNIIKEQQK